MCEKGNTNRMKCQMLLGQGIIPREQQRTVSSQLREYWPYISLTLMANPTTNKMIPFTKALSKLPGCQYADLTLTELFDLNYLNDILALPVST